ncbi:MAG TPA: hypothetical protein VGG04_00505 [Candidatus Sulfotelmatobacter sp.]|jgi:hypothetical protein
MLPKRTRHAKTALFSALLFLSTLGWADVFIRWGQSPLPSANSLGMSKVVFLWNSTTPLQMLTRARKQGYSVYLEAPLQEAAAASQVATSAGCAGIILRFSEDERTKAQTLIDGLRTVHPRLTFLMLGFTGKRPQMKGSLIVKRHSILEVSSPTMQPWIETNIAAIKVAQRAQPGSVPLYTFAWAGPEDAPPTLTASDYSLAIAEASALHADLLLPLDDGLQKTLGQNDAAAWALWSEVRSMAKFGSLETEGGLQPAANVAAVFDDLDPHDEALNLLGRHNIPFQVFLDGDLKANALEDFDLVVVFAKPNQAAAELLAGLASRGKTVVLVDAHGTYPWQKHESIQLNEHTLSYAEGGGKILELSEPVSDPEIFAQDIRRLLGKRDSLLTLWNGLTTVAVPYNDRNRALRQIELVNYAIDPIRVQLQVKGSFTSIRYETPEHGCCQSLAPIKHDAFTEFVIPQLQIGGRIHLD